MNKGEQNLKIPLDTYIKIFKVLPIPTYLWKNVGVDFLLIEYNNYADIIVDGKMKQFLEIKASELYKDNIEILEDLNRCLKEKTSFSKEIRYKYKTKNMEKDLLVRLEFIQPDFVLAHTEDITLQKKTENALKASEKKFRNITEQSLVGIGIAQDYILKYVNQQIADIFEYTINELTNLPLSELFKAIYHADLQKQLDIIEKIKNDPKINTYQFQTRCLKKSGKLFWAEILVKKIEYEGKPAILGIFLDITDKKKAEAELEASEERYRLISENSGAVIWSTDMNLNITYVSPNSPNILGYSDEDAKNLRISTRLTPTSLKIVADILKEELKLEKKKEKNLNRSRTIETEQIHMNGSIIPVEMTITFLRDRTGKAIGILGISRDITERKKAEQKLKQSEIKYRNAFERANFYKDLFAHDINNVLATILSAIELNNLYLNEPSNLSQIKELLQIQKTAVMKGTNLIVNVKKLDEIESAEISIIPVNICKVLKKSVDFVKNSFPLKNIKVDIKTFGTDVRVNANELLEDIFENVMINSVKYNENDPIEIQVKISKHCMQKENFIKVEFIDNGIGISDDRKKIIFQSGFKEQKGSRGMGFGLSLVKKILDRCNGFISVENRVKEDYTKGSNFIVLLPESN